MRRSGRRITSKRALRSCGRSGWHVARQNNAVDALNAADEALKSIRPTVKPTGRWIHLRRPVGAERPIRRALIRRPT